MIAIFSSTSFCRERSLRVPHVMHCVEEKRCQGPTSIFTHFTCHYMSFCRKNTSHVVEVQCGKTPATRSFTSSFALTATDLTHAAYDCPKKFNSQTVLGSLPPHLVENLWKHFVETCRQVWKQHIVEMQGALIASDIIL